MNSWVAGQDVRSVPFNHALESLGGQNTVSSAVDFDEHLLPVCNCDFCFGPEFVESNVSRLCLEDENVQNVHYFKVALKPIYHIINKETRATFPREGAVGYETGKPFGARYSSQVARVVSQTAPKDYCCQAHLQLAPVKTRRVPASINFYIIDKS